MFHYVLFNEGPSLIFCELVFHGDIACQPSRWRDGVWARSWQRRQRTREQSGVPLQPSGALQPFFPPPWLVLSPFAPLGLSCQRRPSRTGRKSCSCFSAPVVCTLGVNTEPRHPGRSAVGGGSVGRVREEVLMTISLLVSPCLPPGAGLSGHFHRSGVSSLALTLHPR